MADSDTALLELARSVLEQNKELTAQIIDLAKEALRSNVPAYVPSVPMETAPYIPAMSETEEDLHFAFKSGAIDEKTYQDRLKEIQFFQQEMTVPSST